MSSVSCSTASSNGGCRFTFHSKTSTLSATTTTTHSPSFIKIGINSQSDRFCIHRLKLVHGNCKARGKSVRMALIDERQSTGKNVADPPRTLAYDLVQGALVKLTWKEDKSVPDTPTAVLVHGILGSGKNWKLFHLELVKLDEKHEKIREWLFFDKPRRAYDSGNRKQRSLPDYSGRGWHESRKQLMREQEGQKRSYYMDPQPHPV